MKKKKCQVVSIQYVHDPEAANKWMELYMEMVKKSILNGRNSKS
ncbi:MULTISPECIES: hypothetical protein [Parageobacillus]|jgi:hypothetical protein|nr:MULTISPECIES: hypothetical protein [Parageobacillus]AEH49134.1 hypothetical protein Geoth_3265 [Parageobacillus thermoglucosidasius C56-YS93]MED4876615.1 hypothetical protein [Anoxybacillus geothermalis]GMO01645.1 hypothetical protein PthstB1num2_36860 [Parageobacillus thermoglucosidasius]